MLKKVKHRPQSPHPSESQVSQLPSLQSKSVTPAILALNMLMLLLESHSLPTLTLLTPPSKQLALLREIPFMASTGLQKNTRFTREGLQSKRVTASLLIKQFMQKKIEFVVALMQKSGNILCSCL
jgi:hypothetical protein